MKNDLEPGEMRLGPTLHCPEHGTVQLYERLDPRGERELGFLAEHDNDEVRTHSAGYVELGPCVRPGVRRITRSITYTARGPVQVASNAYRSGWDAVFGPRREKPCTAEPN